MNQKLHTDTLTDVRTMIASNGLKMQYILSDHISIVSEKTELFVY